MTKEITKANLLQEMADKLRLREFEAANFLFSETVLPIYNIEQHLVARTAKYWELSITSTGAKAIVSVPQTQKWTFHRYDVVFMGAGAYTVAGVYVKRRGIVDTVYLDLEAAKSASYHVTLPVVETLGPGDSLGVNIDGYTSTQDLRVYFDYTIEEMR